VDKHNTDKTEKIFTIPNILTFLRLLLLPLLIISLAKLQTTIGAWRTIAVATGAFMLLSDMLDGFIAKRFNQSSKLGKILDPIADKSIIIAIGTTLVVLGYLSFALFSVMLVRDLLILILGGVLYKMRGNILNTNLIARITPLSWGLLFIFLILKFDAVTTILSYICIILTLVSGGIYLAGYIKAVRQPAD
jgi:cardiolipin synthase